MVFMTLSQYILKCFKKKLHLSCDLILTEVRAIIYLGIIDAYCKVQHVQNVSK